MINPTPNNLDKFPEPVSGQYIPRGWFGRLVRFVNSLILHGDGQYLTVKHTIDGQTIAPTPALLQALGQSGTPPAAGGGASGIEADVTGGTASISLTGGTGSVKFVGSGNVSIDENLSGEIEISGGGGIPYSGVSTTSIRLDNQYHIFSHDGWARMTACIYSQGNSADVGRAYLRVILSGTTTDHLVVENGLTSFEGSAGGSLMIPVVSGSTVQAYIDMDANYSIDYSLLPNEILIYD